MTVCGWFSRMSGVLICESSERTVGRVGEQQSHHLKSGELGVDIEEMRPKLKKLGLTYYDNIDQVPDLRKSHDL